jgi:hypothetical protein
VRFHLEERRIQVFSIGPRNGPFKGIGRTPIPYPKGGVFDVRIASLIFGAEGAEIDTIGSSLTDWAPVMGVLNTIFGFSANHASGTEIGTSPRPFPELDVQITEAVLPKMGLMASVPEQLTVNSVEKLGSGTRHQSIKLS